MSGVFDLYFEISVDERIALKPLVTQDAAQLFKLVNQNRVHLEDWLPWVTGTQKVEDSLFFIEQANHRYETKTGIAFGIFFDKVLSGVCGLQQVCWTKREATVGYWLAESHCNKGVITRCLTRFTSAVFDHTSLETMVAEIDPCNAASRMACEKSRFRLVEQNSRHLKPEFLTFKRHKKDDRASNRPL